MTATKLRMPRRWVDLPALRAQVAQLQAVVVEQAPAAAPAEAAPVYQVTNEQPESNWSDEEMRNLIEHNRGELAWCIDRGGFAKQPQYCADVQAWMAGHQ